MCENCDKWEAKLRALCERLEMVGVDGMMANDSIGPDCFRVMGEIMADVTKKANVIVEREIAGMHAGGAVRGDELMGKQNIERCRFCDCETGASGKGEDSLYGFLVKDFAPEWPEGDEIGPLCEDCYAALSQLRFV